MVFDFFYAMRYALPVLRSPARRDEGGMHHAIFQPGRAEMPERDPIDLIKEQIIGIEGLAGLHANHEAYKKWRDETTTILEKVFSSKSIHCQSFLALRFREMGVTPFASPEIDKINAARYKRDLENARNILQGAIKELTLDRTLFKKIQTTPQSVEFTLKGEYYLSSGIDLPELIQAIQSVFEGSGLTPIHGNEAAKKGESLHQRIDQIKRAQFGIYDVYHAEKPDALLELGAALALGKKTYLLCKKGASLPETLKSFDRMEYEDFPSLIEKLKKATKL
jgi:hypothetical protein